MKRNICSACENCVYNSQSVEFCVKHECGMLVNILKDLEYQRIKCELSSKYGKLIYSDTDSVVSKDDSLCMYDHAKEILEGNIIDKIRAEILEEMLSHSGTGEEVIQAYADGLHKAIELIDKYQAESEDTENN